MKALAVTILLAIFAGLTIYSASQQSATYDEPTHLPAGYAAVAWGDYRLNPEHPPLLKMWAALPLLALDPWPSNPAATEADLAAAGPPTSLRAAQQAYALALANNDMQWYFGRLFLYGLRPETLQRHGIVQPLSPPTTLALSPADYHNDADRLLFWGRLPITVLGLLLALVVLAWAHDLWGWAGGLLALALFCLDPNYIAHSGLVTTDVGLSLFMAAAVYFVWRFGRQPSWPTAVAAVLATALAFAAKFSAVLLLPMVGLLGAWTILRSRKQRGAAALRHGYLVVAMLGASWLTIWTVYGFRYGAAADPVRASQVESRLLGASAEAGQFRLEQVLRQTRATQVLLKYYPEGPPADRVAELAPTVVLRASDRWLLWMARQQLLPEAYLFGFGWMQLKAQVRSAFLNGEYSATGFWDYFLWSFAWKTPLLTMLLIGAGLVVAARRARSALPWLLVPPLLYLGVSMTSNLNIGHRHLLPIYPFLFVLAGGVTLAWKRWKPATRAWSATAVGAGLLLGVLVVWWRPAVVFPHYLAYFNELAGGPRGGQEKLVDSNLDWGQDLKKLRRWLEAHQVTEPIALLYFGMADPLYHGIRYHNLPGGYPFAPTGPLPARGWLAISATHEQGVYFSAEGRAVLRALRERATLVDNVGYSINIYRFNESSP